MNTLTHNGCTVIIPKPLFLVVEDVGWWQGTDGSAQQQPFRTGMPRNHCLADYEALVYLAEQLSMRIVLGMALCEWDRTDFLRDVPGATWMGASWNNQINRGPWLEEAADCLRNNRGLLEIALHGVGHEFWQDGRLQRSEFHDSACWMRSPELIRAHLSAFGELLQQHDLGPFPRAFIPPALKHSFGNGAESFQAILNTYGIQYLTTRFSRARIFSPPITKHITWEENVLLIERGLSPTPWHVVAAKPEGTLKGPIVALHWANLLHADPARNLEVSDAWVTAFYESADSRDTMLAPDLHCCWSQYCHQQLAQLIPEGAGLVVKREKLPPVSYKMDKLFLRIEHPNGLRWKIEGGTIVSEKKEGDGVSLIELEAEGEVLYLRPAFC